MVFKCQPARERGRGGARRGEGRGEVGRGVFVLSWLRASQASDLQLKPKVFLPSCNKILTKKSDRIEGLSAFSLSATLHVVSDSLNHFKDKKGLEEGAASVLLVSFLVVSSLLF